MSVSIPKLFVYGTLRQGCERDDLLRNVGVRIRPATVLGELYALPEGYPGLLEGNDTIVGDLVEWEDAATFRRIMRDLDAYEGYFGENHPRNRYDRCMIDVTPGGSGSTVEANVYLYVNASRARVLGTRIPYGDWKRFRGPVNLSSLPPR
ncbi:MAG: gamma-glutamylcyclotransferase [Candidatus Poribacteria bacterium]|nr:gamma-glutamylcyclotransferase [Candidatus Poribacteria bacterium]